MTRTFPRKLERPLLPGAVQTSVAPGGKSRQVFTPVGHFVVVINELIFCYFYFGKYRRILKKNAKITHKLHHLEITSSNFNLTPPILIFFIFSPFFSFSLFLPF